jgi:hypothetical protein
VANDDYGHVAMPKLFGAPAYARPPITPVEPAERPVDPDDLPIEAEQTEDERALIEMIADGSDTGSQAEDLATSKASDGGRSWSFGLRSIAGLVRGGTDTTTDIG